MEHIYTKKAPKPIGPYSQAVKIGNLVYTSGQIGINVESGNLEDGIANQTYRAINNISEILHSCGSSLDNVIKTTVFVKDIKDFNIINEIYAKFFTNKPARSLVEVSCLPKNSLIEIEVVAFINKK